MGRLLPLTIQTNPGYAAWPFPCRSRVRIRKTVQCETLRSQANGWPALPHGEETHKESYKVKISTFSQYLYVFNNYIAKYKPFHGVKLQELTPALLQSYYNAQLKAGLSPNTVRKHHANIHKCLDYAVRMGKITLNPSIMTELPAKRKYQGATAYTPDQLKTLLRLFRGEPLEVAVQLTVTYGLRRSEVCGLRWDAIDFESDTIHICHTAVMNKGKVVYSDSTKTDSSNRVLPLTSNMQTYLQKVKRQ